MENTIWPLQLFAEGITGESAAVAGQQPAGEIPDRAEQTQDAAANNGRLTWQQIMADPEYNRQMQATIRFRLKAAEAAWQKKAFPEEKVTPKGADEGEIKKDLPKVDPHRQSTRYNAAPHKAGFAGAPEVVAMTEKMRQGRLRQHFDRLQQQAAGLQQVYPDFSLEKALSDPAFVRLTAPHTGVSVENAYYLLNRQKLQGAAMQWAAKRTAEKLSNAISSGTYRPQENGTAARAPSVASFNYATASADQRQALKNAIRRSASRGEKIYPND